MEIYGLGYVLKKRKNLLELYSETGRRRLYANSRFVLAGIGRLESEALHFIAKYNGMLSLRRAFDIVRFDYPGSIQAEILKAQLKAYDDASLKLYLAQKFVYAASLNKLYLLSVLKESNFDVEREESKIREYLDFQVSSVGELRGLEALITREYFAAFRKVIDPIYGFEARTRRPPRDCFNAALSFALALLYKYVKSALESKGFDVRIGYLHEPFRKRPSLALDLAEEFKQPIVDSFMITLFTTNALSVKRDFRREGEAVYLGVRGRKKVLKAFRKRLELKIRGKSLLEWIHLQADKLAGFLLGDEKEYEPFIYGMC